MPFCGMMMGMSILQFIKRNLNNDSTASTETETVRKIIQALDIIEPERAKFIAAFAYLLGRIARADMHISPGETDAMERIIMEHGEMPEEQAVLVVQIAKTQNILFGGTENYLVSREFNSISSHAEKMILLDCLFAVAAASESIATIEDNEISQIADELRIEHRDFISVRSKYRDHLAVLKHSPNR
jgi:uncharacterized tellurite resistance protein B-like protein